MVKVKKRVLSIKVNNMNLSTTILLMACTLASVQLTLGQSKGSECSTDIGCYKNLTCVSGLCVDRCDEAGLCGPNSKCRIHNHTPVCRCAPNTVGVPPTCRPAEPKVECPPNACGKNAFCEVHSGLPVCSCRDSYVGDPFSGCRYECETDGECGSEGCCRNFKCWPADTCEKYVSIIPVKHREVNPEHPCDPDPCSENEICRELNGKAFCQCRYAPYLRLPESGCNSECSSKFNCASEQTCINFRCVDSCPGSCGTNEECYVFNHKAKCRPKNSRPECTSNKDCSAAEACDGFQCVDPCVDYCDQNTDCKIVNQQPMCTCKAGYYLAYDHCYRVGTIVE